MTVYIAYVAGETKGYAKAQDEINRLRIFSDMYETLVEEHNAIADRHHDALNIIDQYDSFVVAMGNNDFVKMVRHLTNISMIRKEGEERNSTEE